MQKGPFTPAFTADDLRRLQEQKFLVTAETFRQVFAAYDEPRIPVFITTDSVLNAFNVLLGESWRLLEVHRSKQLRELVGSMLDGLSSAEKRFQCEPGLVERARRRATIVLATSARLLGAPAGGLSLEEGVAALVEEEVARVHEGTALVSPSWLGPHDLAGTGTIPVGSSGIVKPSWPATHPAVVAVLDYSRFVPRGFYSESPELKQFFRATSFLQAIPWRLEDDEEFVGILMLMESLRGPGGAEGRDETARRFFGSFQGFFATRASWDVSDVHPLLVTSWDLEQVHRARSWYCGEAVAEENRRESGGGSGPGDSPEPTAVFHVLSAWQVPEWRLFDTISHQRECFPSCLDLLAALGSPMARSNGLFVQDPERLRLVDSYREAFLDDSLYGRYLQCLAALFEAPDPAAPGFMRSGAWQARVDATVLGAWAQMCHTCILQSILGVLGLKTPDPAGFVEPVPEFYRSLASLADGMSRWLQDTGVFTLGPAAMSEIVRDLASSIEALPPILPLSEYTIAWERLTSESSGTRWTPQEVAAFDERTSDWEGHREAALLWLGLLDDLGCAPVEVKRKDASTALRRLADRLQFGPLPAETSIRGLLEKLNVDLSPQWALLGTLCRRLEDMSRRQLSGLAADADDEKLILGYSEMLGNVMLYGGDAYLFPRDDAPRIADVFTARELPRRHLEVGIGRPRAIYVLYPWDGREILCRGAVQPGYEFIHRERLTDEAWKALLDSPEAPALPSWLDAALSPTQTGGVPPIDG